MSKIHKPWVSHEELDAFLGGGILDVLDHAAEHEVGGSDLLAFASIPDFGDWIDQAVKQASVVSFAGITDTGVTATNIAAGTTGQRPGGIVGDMRYNGTLGAFEVYTGAWGSVKISGSAPAAHAASHESGGGDAIDLLTFSNLGLHILDTGADHYLTIKPNEDLSANRVLSIITGDAARTVTLQGNPTLADWFDQSVKQAAHVKHASITVGNEGLHVLDTNASHDLIIKPGSDLTADRILTLTTGDAARTITLNGNPTLNDWFDQAVKQASSPTFNALTIVADASSIIKDADDGMLELVGGTAIADQAKIRIYGKTHATLPNLMKIYGDEIRFTDEAGVGRVRIDATGMGIGKVPTEKLDVDGNIMADTARLTDLTDGYIPYHVSDALGLDDSPIIVFGGNVGINVADPDEKLEVNGNIKADTFLLAAGVTPNLGWLSDVVLGSLEEGETIMYDQGTAKFIDAWGVEYDNPRLVWKMYTDFLGSSSAINPPWDGTTISGGTGEAGSGEANHPGIMRFYSLGGTANSGYSFLTYYFPIIIAGREHSEFVFKTPSSLSTVYGRFGFQNSKIVTLPTNGIYINIIGTTLTGKTRKVNAESTTGTSYTLSVNTWYRAKIAVNDVANEATFILYSAAGNQLWSATLSTNIPTGTLGHGAVMYSSGTGGILLVYLDMMVASKAGAIAR